MRIIVWIVDLVALVVGKAIDAAWDDFHLEGEVASPTEVRTVAANLDGDA